MEDSIHTNSEQLYSRLEIDTFSSWLLAPLLMDTHLGTLEQPASGSLWAPPVVHGPHVPAL